MAEHEVTEAMVERDAYERAITDRLTEEGVSHPGGWPMLFASVCNAVTAALAARTTPIAGSDAVTISRASLSALYDAIAHGDEEGLAVHAEPMLEAARALDDPSVPTHPTGAGADADWVLVPREYTDAQLASGIEQLRTVRKTLGEFASDETICGVIYDGMLASSPQQRAPHPPSVRESAGEGE